MRKIRAKNPGQRSRDTEGFDRECIWEIPVGFPLSCYQANEGATGNRHNWRCDVFSTHDGLFDYSIIEN